MGVTNQLLTGMILQVGDEILTLPKIWMSSGNPCWKSWKWNEMDDTVDLVCITPSEKWDKLSTSTGERQISSINSTSPKLFRHVDLGNKGSKPRNFMCFFSRGALLTPSKLHLQTADGSIISPVTFNGVTRSQKQEPYHFYTSRDSRMEVVWGIGVPLLRVYGISLHWNKHASGWLVCVCECGREIFKGGLCLTCITSMSEEGYLKFLHKNCPLRYFTRGEPFLRFCMSVFF